MCGLCLEIITYGKHIKTCKKIYAGLKIGFPAFLKLV